MFVQPLYFLISQGKDWCNRSTLNEVSPNKASPNEVLLYYEVRQMKLRQIIKVLAKKRKSFAPPKKLTPPTVTFVLKLIYILLIICGYIWENGVNNNAY